MAFGVGAAVDVVEHYIAVCGVDGGAGSAFAHPVAGDVFLHYRRIKVFVLRAETGRFQNAG